MSIKESRNRIYYTYTKNKQNITIEISIIGTVLYSTVLIYNMLSSYTYIHTVYQQRYHPVVSFVSMRIEMVFPRQVAGPLFRRHYPVLSNNNKKWHNNNNIGV